MTVIRVLSILVGAALVLPRSFGRDGMRRRDFIVGRVRQRDGVAVCSGVAGNRGLGVRTLFYEKIPQARVHRLQRRAEVPQFPAKCGLARQPTPQKEGRLNPASCSVWNSPAVLHVLDLRRAVEPRVNVNEQRTFRHVTFLPPQTRENLH